MKLRNKAASAIAATAVVTTLAVTGFAAPALAAISTRCTVPWSAGTMRCTTPDWVPANAANQIRVEVLPNSGCNSRWVVYDITTGRNAASGRGRTNRVLSGVYGIFTASLTDACWKDTIILRNY